MAIFNFEGKIPLQSDWLIIKDKGSAISRDISFKNVWISNHALHSFLGQHYV